MWKEQVIRYYLKTYLTDDYKENGDWININSIHADDSRYCLGFNVETNGVHDFKLEESWSFESFVAKHQDIGMEDGGIEVREFLMGLSLKLGVGIKNSPVNKKRTVLLPIELKALPHGPEDKPFDLNLSWEGKKALRYLLDRGLGPKHIKKFGLTYSDCRKCYVCHGTGFDEDDMGCSFCSGSGYNPYYKRLIIPTYENKNLIYFQGRMIDTPRENDLRYMNPKAPRMQVVYFYDQLEEGQDIYMTEGPIDAMTLIDYNCTCQMSLHLSDPQILKIAAKKPKRLIFVPDYDETQTKRTRAANKLSSNIKRFIELTDRTITVGVYLWYKSFSKQQLLNEDIKDINAANITVIDEKLIRIVHHGNNEKKLKMH